MFLWRGDEQSFDRSQQDASIKNIGVEVTEGIRRSAPIRGQNT